jgi:hypothetical protein
MVASLNVSGKVPEVRDRLTMDVMTGASISVHCFRREVGIGSESHCLSGDSLISFLISSMVAGTRLVSSEGGDGGETKCGDSDGGTDSITLLRFVTFSEK